MMGRIDVMFRGYTKSLYLLYLFDRASEQALSAGCMNPTGPRQIQLYSRLGVKYKTTYSDCLIHVHLEACSLPRSLSFFLWSYSLASVLEERR